MEANSTFSAPPATEPIATELPERERAAYLEAAYCPACLDDRHIGTCPALTRSGAD
jgi:hypothetical protein